MRPRKIVVVYSADPEQAGIWTFKLNLTRYLAIPVTTPAQLADALSASDQSVLLPDAVLICVPTIEDAEPLVALMPRFTDGIVLSVASEVINVPAWTLTPFCRIAGTLPGHVFEYLKVATARQRGPRKGAVRTPPAEAAPVTAQTAAAGGTP